MFLSLKSLPSIVRPSSAARGALLVMFVVASATACGSSPTNASPTGASPASTSIHDTLNAVESAASANTFSSELSGAYDREVYDDFVSATAATIRTVAWQGARPTARPPSSFYVAFIADNNGYVRWEYDSSTGRQKALFATTYSIDQVNERLSVTQPCDGAPQTQCGGYDYSVTLPAPFVTTAGSRYWLLIQAVSPLNAQTGWAWQKGQPDNRFSMSNIANSIFTWDFAFALRP